MAQFDVYPNPSPAQRAYYPYVVVMQSDQLDRHSTRWVMPLARLQGLPADLPRRLAATVEIEGEALHLAAHLGAPLPARVLSHPILNLRDQSAVLIDALDAVISGL
jgi:toxin CcdB